VQTDPLTGIPCVHVPARGARTEVARRRCPFCWGSEDDSPPELARISDGEGWLARAVPNLYPIAAGHEILVPTGRHVTRWSNLTIDELQVGVRLWADRLDAHADAAMHTHLFVNDGAGAGATIPHCHAQLLPLAPTPVSTEVRRNLAPTDCTVCALVVDESLVVERVGSYALVAHPRPALPGALILAATTHATDPAALASRAHVSALHRAIAVASADVDLNLVVYADVVASTHLTVVLIPRTAQFAGLELSAGVNVSVHAAHRTVERAQAALAALES
jgi:galactose-1-phosphate uridylyltransferase